MSSYLRIPTIAAVLGVLITSSAGAGQTEPWFFPPPGEGLDKQSRCRPEQVGLDRGVIKGLAGKASRWALWRRGYLVHVEGDWNQTQDVASLRKTWHALTVAAAVDQGKIPDYHQKIKVWEPDLAGKDAAATWRHLITQSSGFDFPHPDFPHIGDPQPGEVWTYSDKNPRRLCNALAKAYGKKDFEDHYDDVIRAAYFDAIGMRGWSTRAIRDGIRFRLDLEDMGRLGLLVAARGNWNGKQVIPRWFIEELETRQTDAMRPVYNGPDDGNVGGGWFHEHRDEFPKSPYGYMTWVNTGGDFYPGADRRWAFAAGAGGTYVLWNHANGIVFAGVGVDTGPSAEGIPHVLERNLTSDLEVTTIHVTDRVLVDDTVRFGINLGGDSYYSGAVLVKKRARENFEGTIYRQCHFGPGADEEGMATWFRPSEDWVKVLTGGRYTILSGPSKGTTGTLRAVTSKPYLHEGQKKDFAYFLLDKKIQPPPPGGGIMIQRLRTGDGQFRSRDGHWTSKGNEISIGDVPPGSFGCAALALKGATQRAHVRFGTHYQRYGQTNGTWQVHFWAKAIAGDPELTISPEQRAGESIRLKPPATWTHVARSLVVDKVPEPKGPRDNPHLTFVIAAAGGDVLIDDVEIWMEGDTNPTAFRDDCVATLRRFNPGPLRKLQMGGSTLENTLAGPLRSYSYASRPGGRALGPYVRHTRDDYGLHEMYELCEYLKCDPWFCLPGTLSPEEMERFMEYLGAPAEVGYGKRRAELGHPRPWTEVFDRIHVEFGNEAWNNAGPYQCGGFNGPDYWMDLIAAGKASRYYTPKVLFHAAGQASYSGRNQGIMANCPNADRFGVAPYLIQGFSKEEYASHLSEEEDFFRWAFAWPIYRSRDPQGAMFQNHELAKQAGMEMSIYEVNHHTTHGDGPLEPRNKLVTSIGGGINVLNNMLLMMKEHHLRTQCLFSLVQHGYNARGIGQVRLWGTALCMRDGHERYRPTFLACATANKVIGGDLVETLQRGADPKFAATGIFSKREGVRTIENLPVIFSYAFARGKRRGLILVSLDPAGEHSVAVTFAGRPARAAADSWLLTARKITDNNEYEAGQPQVEVVEQPIPGFQSGTRLALPPFSMRALAWEVQ